MMNKKNDIFDSKEYKVVRKHYKEWMEEMKKDEQEEPFEVPGDWEKKFKQSMKKTLKEKEKCNKNKQKKSIKRSYIKKVVVATAATIVLGLMAVSVSQEVYGNGWLKIIKNIFSNNGKEYISFGTEDTAMIDMHDESDDMYFEGMSLDEMYDSLPTDAFPLMFGMKYIPEGYTMEEASYSKQFSLLNIKLEKQKNSIYIAQNIVGDKSSFGKTRSDEIEKVYNEFLQKEVSIFSLELDGAYTFYLEEQNVIFSCNITDSLEECEKIAENIYIR